MPTAQTLHDYLNALLVPEQFADYCPNGLQVQGAQEIRHLVAGVTACQALLDRAVAQKAQAVLVHHGYFWKGDAPEITGTAYRRLRTLLRHDINLFAYHLPLDAHAVYGNNARLAKQLDLRVTGDMSVPAGTGVGLLGEPDAPMTLDDFGRHVAQRLERAPLCIAGGAHPIRTLAWCTGAAQDEIARAKACGADAYLSGEISERTVHLARELGIHYIAAGHHATERYGVKALAQHLAQKFDMACEFIDIDNPA